MAIKVPTGCYRQPTESRGKDASDSDTFDYVLKGPHSDLETLLKSLYNGKEILSGWVMSSASLQRNSGNVGTLTITCSSDADGEEGTENNSETSTKALKEVWSLRSVRNDVSILAYCGNGKDSPCREWIEAWQKEPDGKVASIPGFTLSDGTVFRFGGGDRDDENRATATREIIAKIQKGIDSVMRFYPQITRTRTYSKPPSCVYENLATIDTPEVGSETDFEKEDEETNETTSVKASAKRLVKPGNLDSIIGAHEWLKCQDDCSQTADGKYQRVESWIGIIKSDGGWDENLYGGKDSNRWPMPYNHSENSKG